MEDEEDDYQIDSTTLLQYHREARAILQDFCDATSVVSF